MRNNGIIKQRLPLMPLFLQYRNIRASLVVWILLIISVTVGCSREPLRRFHAECLAFSPDGKLFAAGGGSRYTEPGTVYIWNVPGWTKKTKLENRFTSIVYSVAFSPDSRMMIAGGTRLRTMPSGINGWGEIQVFDVRNWHTSKSWKAHRPKIDEVIISPNGQLICTRDGCGDVYLWDFATGREVATPSLESTDSSFGVELSGISFSHDGTTLATISKNALSVQLWTVPQCRLTKVYRSHNHILSLAFSPDGGKIALASYEGSIQLWDIAPDHSVTLPAAHTDRVNAVVFTPDGRTLISGGHDKMVNHWDVTIPKPVKIKALSYSSEVMQLAISPGGQFLAVSTGDTISIRDHGRKTIYLRP